MNVNNAFTFKSFIPYQNDQDACVSRRPCNPNGTMCQMMQNVNIYLIDLLFPSTKITDIYAEARILFHGIHIHIQSHTRY